MFLLYINDITDNLGNLARLFGDDTSLSYSGQNFVLMQFEDAIHYFLECPLYLNERRTLLSDCDNININIEILLFGNDDDSYAVNSKMFGKVRTFINQSKRF